MIQGCPPLCSFGSDGFPAFDVDVDVLYVSLRQSLNCNFGSPVPQLMLLSFPLEHGLQDFVKIHATHMIKPTQSALFEKGERDGKGGLVKNFSA